jgi:hypothetical protein
MQSGVKREVWSLQVANMSTHCTTANSVTLVGCNKAKVSIAMVFHLPQELLGRSMNALDARFMLLDQCLWIVHIKQQTRVFSMLQTFPHELMFFLPKNFKLRYAGPPSPQDYLKRHVLRQCSQVTED